MSMQLQQFEATVRTDPSEDVAAFRAAWHAGRRPSLRGFLSRHRGHPTFRDFATHLAKIHLGQQVKAGDAAPLIEALLAELRESGAVPSPVEELELIRQEYDDRWQRGERGVTRQDYLIRFPQHHEGIAAWKPPMWNCPVCRREDIPLVSESDTWASCPNRHCRTRHRVSALFAATGGPDSAASASTFPPGPNSTFPCRFGERYELRQLLGNGGMGCVYLAFDLLLERDVALKVPHAKFASDPDVRDLFLHEAQAGVRLDHPNLCRVLDLGAVGGFPYLTMTYIQGNKLSECCPAGWDPQQAAALVGTLARALSAAHAQGIIHRDLKPSNILITAAPENRPLITDFGLALRLGARTARVPGPGQVAGTIPYMAPEQVQPGLQLIGPRSDVYSLGVILYELLTGRRPFLAEAPHQLVRQILGDPVVPPALLRPGIPAGLERACLKAMARDVHDRFLVMEDFAAELEKMVHMERASSASSPGSLPHLEPQQVRFAFAGMGEQAPPSALQRNQLFLDVGNGLRPGVIDHHHLVGFCGSTTRLVLNRPDLLDAVLLTAQSSAGPFTLICHQHPDLDCFAASYLALHYLYGKGIPAGANLLASHVDRVDNGSLGMPVENPFTLYSACRILVERHGSGDENWQKCVRDGMRLVEFALEVAVQQGDLLEVDAFACPGLFSDQDRAAVRDDLQRYERKLADPSCRARSVRLVLPGQFGGVVEVDALLVRHVQDEGDPQRCLFFKDWARNDSRRAPNGIGFAALSVFMIESDEERCGSIVSATPKQRRACIVSATPESRATFRGLGAMLEDAESARRRKTLGMDDRVYDPVTGAVKMPREGYSNSDPWYDGRAHGYTIVDSPREGTRLEAEEIEELLLRFGRSTPESARAIVSPSASVGR